MRKHVMSAAAGLGVTPCGSGPDSGSGGGEDEALVVGATAVPAGEVLS